jgi:hypothetical protein
MKRRVGISKMRRRKEIFIHGKVGREELLKLTRWGRKEGEEKKGERKRKRKRKKYIEMKLFSYDTLAHH